MDGVEFAPDRQLPVRSVCKREKDSDSRSRLLFWFFYFFVLALLTFSHDRSPCVVEIAQQYELKNAGKVSFVQRSRRQCT
jgi:hypothetical protein